MKNKDKTTEVLMPQTLARLITRVHNYPEALKSILENPDVPAPKAHIVGITGSTAAGKSTLIDKIIRVLRLDNWTVIVLAIDPTEEESGGAVLGDTIRMRDHYLDPGVFLRSFGSRGASGALTKYLSQVIELVSRFADFVIVETAGAGQADTLLKQCVNTFVVLPDTRADAVNLLKAGHHRQAHILAVNVRAGSAEDEKFFALAKSFSASVPVRDGWQMLVFKVNARSGDGVEDLARHGIYARGDFIAAKEKEG